VQGDSWKNVIKKAFRKLSLKNTLFQDENRNKLMQKCALAVINLLIAGKSACWKCLTGTLYKGKLNKIQERKYLWHKERQGMNLKKKARGRGSSHLRQNLPNCNKTIRDSGGVCTFSSKKVESKKQSQKTRK